MSNPSKILNDLANKADLFRSIPHNILAEQFLLGAILTNNELYNRVNDFLLGEHFYEPVHSRIYEAIGIYLERSMSATPITLKNYFDKDLTLLELGGASYLAKLAGLSTTIINALDHGRIIYDLAIRRKLINIGELIVNEAYEQEIEKTALEQIERAEQELFNLASEGKTGENSGFCGLKNSLINAIEKITIAHRHKEQVTGVSTGFIDLDNILCGFQDSDLLILAARPSMGKTALAVNLAINSCNYLFNKHQASKSNEQESPPSVGFFSLEMSSDQLAARMLSMSSTLNASKLRSGHIDDRDFSKLLNSAKNLQQLPFFIDDTPALSISALRTRARRLKRRHNLALLFVDYLQLVKGSSKSSEANRVQEVSEITQGLKAIAKELNIPVIALSQLSRAVEQREDKRPLLSDLRESGSIEQDADIVMFIYRDEYYISRREPRAGTEEHNKWQAEMDQAMNISEIIIAKQRNGPIGNIKLYFDAHTTKFTNFSKN